MTTENQGKPGNTGLKRIIKATGYSIQGLKAAFKYEAAIRQELVLLCAAIIALIWLDVSPIETVPYVERCGSCVNCRVDKFSY